MFQSAPKCLTVSRLCVCCWYVHERRAFHYSITGAALDAVKLLYQTLKGHLLLSSQKQQHPCIPGPKLHWRSRGCLGGTIKMYIGLARCCRDDWLWGHDITVFACWLLRSGGWYCRMMCCWHSLNKQPASAGKCMWICAVPVLNSSSSMRNPRCRLSLSLPHFPTYSLHIRSC